jgi:hypothetical protein
MVTGKFVAVDVPTLTLMLQQWQQCLTAIALNQSYSIAGRSYTRADLEAASEMVSELSYALELKKGNLVRVVYSDMSCP